MINSDEEVQIEEENINEEDEETELKDFLDNKDDYIHNLEENINNKTEYSSECQCDNVCGSDCVCFCGGSILMHKQAEKSEMRENQRRNKENMRKDQENIQKMKMNNEERSQFDATEQQISMNQIQQDLMLLNDPQTAREEDNDGFGIVSVLSEKGALIRFPLEDFFQLNEQGERKEDEKVDESKIEKEKNTFSENFLTQIERNDDQQMGDIEQYQNSDQGIHQQTGTEEDEEGSPDNMEVDEINDF
ncbi:MAG: hypothetical protein EZS28_046357 [Streblomastix strix]|uniref:Uncharacterized protein n=1 Tax=Streblomastix strix TaxID=222440 RepID=A0A5J4TI32_9EUKA|nr:MAG: hypothetical protein EZS28_046357 [Streblomastix strix]